jgi:hypothetical protein
VKKRRSDGSLTVGSLRGDVSAGRVIMPARAPFPRPAMASAIPIVQSATELPPSKRGQRCCRTGCAGCPVGEAIRRARAQKTQS